MTRRRRRASRVRLLFVSLITLGGALGALGSTARAESGDTPLSVAAWTTGQGLPSQAIAGLWQTRDGYLWIASSEGLLRFDGTSFRAFTDTDSPTAVGASVTSLAEDADGVLWAATDSGLVRYERGRFSVLTTRDGLASNQVTKLAVGRSGSVWIGGRGGVSLYERGRIDRLPPPPALSQLIVSALVEDAGGTLWIGTIADGLVTYRAGRYAHIGTADGLPDPRITALAVDRTGAVWVGAYGAGLGRIAHGLVTLVATGSAAPRRVADIREDPDGTMWIAAENGVFRIVADRAVPVVERDGRRFTQVETIWFDVERNVWLGTHEAGLFRLRTATFTALTRADGLPADVVYAIADDGAGGAWVGTEAGPAHWTADGTIADRAASAALGDAAVRDVIRDRAGGVWMATDHGLVRLAGGRATSYSTRDGLPDDRVRALAEDRSGTIWVGTVNGLVAFRDGRMRRYGRADGLSDTDVLSVLADRADTVWVGTGSGGLFRFDGERFASAHRNLTDDRVFRIRQSGDGALWAGTSRGLVRIGDDRLVRFTTSAGLPGNTVFDVVEDDLGYRWVTGPWGIARAAAAAFAGVASGTRPSLDVKRFGTEDGLPAREVSSMSRAWRAPDGTLWFGTPRGVARVDPRQVRRNERPPSVHIERALVDDAPRETERGDIDIASGARTLEIQYSAPSFVAPDEVRYRYRLEGFDAGWIDAGARRVAFYTNVRPGRYTFRVQARNADGVWSAEGAALPFLVQPHVWQTPWFVAACLVALAAIVVGGHRVRVRRAQRAIQEIEREAARRRLAEILESISDAFVALDGDWRFTFVNRTAEELLGLPRADLLGRVCWDVLPSGLTAQIEHQLRCAAAERAPIVLEALVSRGANRWVELHAYPAETGGLSIYFGDLTVRKAAEAAMRSQTLHDELTGLYNRRGLMALAQQQARTAERTGHGFDILFIDMDGMKAINDTLGHPAGDQALADTAALLTETFRESDVLARFGGDEFAVLLLGQIEGGIATACSRLQAAVAGHNATAGRPYELSLSIGHSHFDPVAPQAIEDLLDEADQRMYDDKRGKGSGRGRQVS